MPGVTFKVHAGALPRDDLKHLHMTGCVPTICFQGDQRFSYSLYIPESAYPPTPLHPERIKIPLVVVIHGGKSDHIRARNAWIEYADKHGVAILAPLFPLGVASQWDTDAYRFLGAAPQRTLLSNTNGDHALKRPQAERLLYDRLLLSMIEEVGMRWSGLDTEKFFLGGFSGGGQFSHRFLYLHPERLLGVCIGGPGFITLMDSSLEWPLGIGGMDRIFDKSIDKKAISQVPVLVACGLDDVSKDTFIVRDRVHGAIEGLTMGSKGADLRTNNAKDLAESLESAGCQVTLEYIPNVAHEMPKVQPAMGAFLAPLIVERQNKLNYIE
ncbi:hypothetical protein BU24DRAFT_472380 [Aaosphaeria arxii CBS 175.79]|uniref:Alpha/beta-hydrolase n=1 Tax=Aaosphaeria arxii CBS 175.79 TaxID=1450172 RepID=A0A6A5XBH1_9PLEO|nr:uncharacterized protein BU24DRAFT_472380 [Aaosphaeria arxii CBS 175.79]KAF2010270.1 hypothetical protein BU24DRAFT_472380 [Aaosphaeria arxii CBS 175.79]